MLKKAISMLLSVVTVLSILTCAMGVAVPVKAATANQLNIDARANYLYNIVWTCQKTVAGWNGNYYFYQGQSYHLPYGQPINSGYYIGYGVSVDTFVTSTQSSSSVFYNYQSSYGSTYSTYYATDCSAFVSWCWGIDRKTTYSIPQVSTNLGYCTASNAYKLQLGDALNSNSVGHVVLVTGLTYDSSGNLTQIEITEQTPPQLKRSYYTPATLGATYGSYYTIQRYTGTVPAAPDGSVGENTGTSGGTSTSSKYYPACSSTYTSLYPAMESIGVTCTWELQKRIAAANGIADFTGTAEQNTTLLNLLKAGKLINPDYTGGTSSGTGYENGYDGSMAGSGTVLAKGIDISSWQGDNVNFNAFKAAGYSFVILRCGTSKGKDAYFEKYYTQAKAAGLDVGVYYYAYCTTVAAATADANACLQYISGKTFEYPIYLDYETEEQGSLSDETSGAICLEFLRILEKNGYLAGMYSMASRIGNTWVTTSGIRDYYEGWVAHYASGTYDAGYTTYGPTYSTQYGMYQFTDKHYITYGGVSYGPYDGDVAYKDYPTIVKTYGFNGYGGSGPVPEAVSVSVSSSPSSGGAVTTTSSAVMYGSEVTLNAVANKGYYFAGWYIPSDQTYTIVSGDLKTSSLTIAPTSNITAQGLFESGGYTVTFVDWDGTVISTQQVAQGGSATAPESPSIEPSAKYTYTFAGWDTDYTNITANTVVTATYKRHAREYAVTFLNYDGTVLDTQQVAYGESAAAPENPTRPSTSQYTYTFAGWDTDYTNITADTTVTATYSQSAVVVKPVKTGKLRIEVTGGTGFTIAVNDGAARPQGTSYVNSKTPIGATVTVVASGTSEFAGWMNSSGAIVSVTETYTFTTSGNDNLKAVYMTEVEGVNVVIFKNGKAAGGKGQVLDMQYYAAGDEVVFPGAPTAAGYDFTGWDKTAEEIKALIAAGEDVTVLATWEAAKIYIDVAVNGGTISTPSQSNGKYLAYNALTVVANAAEAGKKFAYWADAKGNIMSYDAEYKFFPATSTELTAVYVAEDEEIKKQPLVFIAADPTTAGEKITYTMSWDIDANIGTVTSAGLLVVNKADYNGDTFYHGTTDTKVFDRALGASAIKQKNTYGIGKGSSLYDNTYIACTFVVYTDAVTGESITVYSTPVEVYKPAP